MDCSTQADSFSVSVWMVIWKKETYFNLKEFWIFFSLVLPTTACTFVEMSDTSLIEKSCKISDRPNTFTGSISDFLSILVKLSTWGNMTTGHPLKFLRHEATSRRSITTPSRCFPLLLPPSFLACPSPFPHTQNPLSLPFQMAAKQATWIQKDRTQLH